MIYVSSDKIMQIESVNNFVQTPKIDVEYLVGVYRTVRYIRFL